jgi:hypothetical protein
MHAIIALLAFAKACNGFSYKSIPKSSVFGLEQRKSLHSMNHGNNHGNYQMSLMSEFQELRSPKAMYTNAVEVGANKSLMSPLKTFFLGILSGCHISFGEG